MFSKQNYEETISVAKEGKERFVKVKEAAARPSSSSSSSSSAEEEDDQFSQFSIATEIIATTVGETRNDKSNGATTTMHIPPSAASSNSITAHNVVEEEDDTLSIVEEVATEIIATAVDNVRYDARNDENVMSTPRRLSTNEVPTASVRPTAEEEKDDARDYNITTSSASCCAVDTNGVLWCGCGEEGREGLLDVVDVANVTSCLPEFVPEWGIGDGVKDAEVALLQTFGMAEKVDRNANSDVAMEASEIDASKEAADRKEETAVTNEKYDSIVAEATPQMTAYCNHAQDVKGDGTLQEDVKEDYPSKAAADPKKESLATKETVPPIRKTTDEKEDASSEYESYSCTGEELKSIVLQNLSRGYESVVKVTEMMTMTNNRKNESIVEIIPKTDSEQIAGQATSREEDEGKPDNARCGAKSIVFDNLSEGYESAVETTEKKCMVFKDDLSKGYELAIKATEANITQATNEIESIANNFFPMLTVSKREAHDATDNTDIDEEEAVAVADEARDANDNPIAKQSDTEDGVAITSDPCCSCTDDRKEAVLSADQLKSNALEYILNGYNSVANATKNGTIFSFSQPNDEGSSKKKEDAKTKIGDSQKKMKESQQQQLQQSKSPEKFNRVEQQQKLEAYLQSLADHAIKTEKAATAQQEESKIANEKENDEDATGFTTTTTRQGKLDKALCELKEKRKSSSVEKLKALLNDSGGSSSTAAFQK